MRRFYLEQLSEGLLGQEVTLYGWVHRRRDHGGVIFIDLRDRTGIAQIVCSPMNPALFKVAESIRNEYCLKILGRIRNRPDDSINPALGTGTIEVDCIELHILNTSSTPPFLLDDDSVSENTRLSHRILDLRRPKMQQNLILRYRVSMLVRNYLDKLGFIDIETPTLTKSTPEGARDYLIPSRVHPGHFFALPQSPQLFKQLLMVAGFDRYYQITKCFRDEDLRSDRQPEFTQIDCEVSFATEQEIRDIFEEMIRMIFRETLEIELPSPFPVISYQEALNHYGSDKPDLRVLLKLTDITELMTDVDFSVFRKAAELPHGKVVCLRIPGGASISRGEIDSYTNFVSTYGAKGLAWIKVNDISSGREGLQSPIVKNLHDHALKEILAKTQSSSGDLLFFGAGNKKIVNDSMGALRLHIGLSDKEGEKGWFVPGWNPLWVVDFPMFEYDEIEKRWVAVHHPFTAPKDEHEEILLSKPEECIAKAYDMVLNGWEIGGGSIRIHNAITQNKIFQILNISKEQSQQKFGFLLDALQLGAPPHGGIAFGLDRLTALMVHAESIREVIAFPKTQRAQCLLTEAPSPVDVSQLQSLHLCLQKNSVGSSSTPD